MRTGTNLFHRRVFICHLQDEVVYALWFLSNMATNKKKYDITILYNVIYTVYTSQETWNCLSFFIKENGRQDCCGVRKTESPAYSSELSPSLSHVSILLESLLTQMPVWWSFQDHLLFSFYISRNPMLLNNELNYFKKTFKTLFFLHQCYCMLNNVLHFDVLF